MKAATGATARTTGREADPWRLGFRTCRVVGPDGQEHEEDRPLTPEDFVFPEEEDRFMYNRGHARDCNYLEDILDERCVARPGLLALREHRVDFGIIGIRPLGPDLSVFSRVRDWDNRRGTFRVLEMRAKSLLVIEVTSPVTRDKDLVVKLDLLHRCKVPCYAIVDRQAGEDGDEVRVLGYKRARTRYLPLTEENGRVWLEPVGLWLGVEKDRAICYDEKGERLAPPNERAQKAEREKDRLQKRVEQLEAELHKASGEE